MAKKAFSGDADYRLPKGKIEPYRLWFEYLKLALSLPDIRVDQNFYAPWGNVREEGFETWWDKHWRKLFATPPAVVNVMTKKAAEEALADSGSVLVRVFLRTNKKQRYKELDVVLMGRSPRLQASLARPAFEIDSRRSINYRTLRGMLRLCQLYDANGQDIEKASIAYLQYSKNWNDKVRANARSKLPLVYEPPFLSSFIEEISRKRRGSTKGERGSYDALRNRAVKFLRRGEQVLKNVAHGRFPGRF